MYKKFFKRLIDIVLSLIALPFVLLVIVIMAPFINLEDKGPVFYNAERRGKDGKPFKMFKLRSMYVNAPDIRTADGSTFNSDKDPRVTKIGRFMRKTSIDELPQILNVLIGDMSLIGPRPLLVQYLPLYSPEQARRHEVRPGITGWAQVNGRNLCKLSKKFAYDVWYVDNVSFSLDIKILYLTIVNVLKRLDVGSGSGNMKDVDDLGFKERMQKI